MTCPLTPCSFEAEYALRAHDAAAFGWSGTRWRAVLDDLFRLDAIVQPGSAAAAARVYVDRRTNEARVAILDTPSFTVTRRGPAHSRTAPRRHAHD